MRKSLRIIAIWWNRGNNNNNNNNNNLWYGKDVFPAPHLQRTIEAYFEIGTDMRHG